MRSERGVDSIRHSDFKHFCLGFTRRKFAFSAEDWIKQNMLKSVSVQTSVVLLMVVVTAVVENIVEAGESSSRVTINEDFRCGDTVICTGDTVTGEGRLLLTGEPNDKNSEFFRYTVGMALHPQPIRVVDSSTGQSVSFSTSFRMRNVPQAVNLTKTSIIKMPGDGLMFLLTANSSWLGGKGGSLGVYDVNGKAGAKTLAVEFDTFYNPEFNDISNNHVGVDIETVVSRVATPANATGVDVVLFDGTITHAWIDYDGVSHELQVRISRSGATNSSSTSPPKPTNPLLTYTVDLVDVMDEHAWVGFAAANGLFVSSYSVYSWEFSSWGLPAEVNNSSNSAAGLGGPRHSVKAILVVGVAVAAMVLLGICVCWAVKLWRARRRMLRERQLHEEYLRGMASVPNTFSYRQLSAATNGFSELSKLGQGGFGSVYSGVLPTSTGIRTPVAIKRVASASKQGEKEFEAEVSIISQIRHRNIVQLLGWCRENKEFLLVYELMANGSLAGALFADRNSAKPAGSVQGVLLSWSQRFKIAAGLAAALDYLHAGSSQQVIHRDVKSTNIMLDTEFNAKLGDFGLARMVAHHENAWTTEVAGTYGYIAPEALAHGQVGFKFTDKTDVYAFGAVALEICCGRKALDVRREGDEVILVDWVWNCLSQGCLLSAVDQRLGSEFNESQAMVVMLIGLLCSHPDPACRPSMRLVMEVLSGDVVMPPVPMSKPSAMYTTDSQQFQIRVLHDSSTSATDSENRQTSNSSTVVNASWTVSTVSEDSFTPSNSGANDSISLVLSR